MFRFFVIAVALVGCQDEQLTQVESIRDEVCACKTVACGEAAMKRVPQDKIKSTHKMQTVANAMLDCMARLYDETRPTTDPDAEPAAAEPTSPGSAAPASAKTP